MPKQELKDEIYRLLHKLPPTDIPEKLEQRVLTAVHEQQHAVAIWETWRRRAITASSVVAVASLFLFARNLAGSGLEELLATVALNPDVIPALGADLLLGLLEALPLGSLVTTIGALSLLVTLRAIKITAHSLNSSATA